MNSQLNRTLQFFLFTAFVDFVLFFNVTSGYAQAKYDRLITEWDKVHIFKKVGCFSQELKMIDTLTGKHILLCDYDDQYSYLPSLRSANTPIARIHFGYSARKDSISFLLLESMAYPELLLHAVFFNKTTGQIDIYDASLPSKIGSNEESLKKYNKYRIMPSKFIELYQKGLFHKNPYMYWLTLKDDRVVDTAALPSFPTRKR